MVSINKSVLDSCIQTFSVELEKQRREILHNLQQTKSSYFDQMDHSQKRFLKKIIQKISVCNLMTLDKDSIGPIITEIGKTPNPSLKIKLTDKDRNSLSDKAQITISYKDLLVAKFNYSVYRGNFYPRLFSKLGINSCVYCNSQLALNVEKNTYTKTGKLNGRVKVAKYQLDHAFSKADYPYLSATVYNLYPCCGVCNNIKRKKEVNFKLYSNSELPSPYKFSLRKDSLAKYMTSYDLEELVITFDDPDKPVPDREGKGSLEDTFHISSIYSTQKDIAEEIIVRSHIYNDTYRKDLEDSFSSIFPGSGFSMERIFLGTYPDYKDIHRRPLSKFIQDITSDIKRLSIEIK